MDRDLRDQPHSAFWLAIRLLFCMPRYKVLICADYAIPPSPWTDKFRVEVDHYHNVVRISGSLT